MPTPSIFSFQNGGPVDPRSILSSIGEVVYGWDVPVSYTHLTLPTTERV